MDILLFWLLCGLLGYGLAWGLHGACRAWKHWRSLLLHILLLLLWASHAHAQTPAACTHFASVTGSGAVCTQAQPCQIERFWALAGPGKTLCLKSGVYTGASQMILPPPGLKGTQNAPITVRAEHDGAVTLDAQHQGFAVSIGWHDGRSNDWFVVEGINAKNGLEAIMQVAGSHSVLRRVIAWDGTSGAPTQGISVVGYGSRAEDCAAWGMNLRKIFQGSQSGNLQGAGYRRCWGEWNDEPETEQRPNNTLQIGYNTTNQLFENLILTQDAKGQTGENEGAIGAMTTNTAGNPNDIEGTRLFGSVLYVRPGSTYTAAAVFLSSNTTGFTVTDLAMVVPNGYPTKYPAYFLACKTPPCSRNVCTNCLSVHDGQPLVNEGGSGWSLPGLREGRGLAAATGGASAFALLPGLCREYVNGEITETKLWPWRMDARIREARLASGARPVTVTEEVASVLGDIPAACRRSTDPEPPIEPPIPPIPPAGTPLNCVGVQGETGVVAIACTPNPATRR